MFIAWTTLLILTALVLPGHCKIYFEEDFSNDKKWTPSSFKSDYGAMELVGGERHNLGYKTSKDSHFYATSAELSEEFDNEKKDFVVSFTAKNPQGLDCGGAYLKFLPKLDPKKMHGESEYSLMFGPDKCGMMNKIHIILNHLGKNVDWKKQSAFSTDLKTHIYTLQITAKNSSYALYVDRVLKESGSVEADWDILPPKEINDETDKKPSDWVDDATIPDPDDVEPEESTQEPEQIVDPTATQPEDWITEEDGEWEAPMIKNPKYKKWVQKRIPNPKYKGPWEPKKIPNPEYKPDNKQHKFHAPVKHVGIDVWQVKSGTIFGNIIVGDNLSEIEKKMSSVWDAIVEAEKDEESAKSTSPSEDKEDDTAKEDNADEKEEKESKDEL